MGEEAVRKSIDSLGRYSIPPGDYAVYVEKKSRSPVQEVKIASVNVEVEGESKISPEVIADRIGLQKGDIADIETLEKGSRVCVRHGRF